VGGRHRHEGRQQVRVLVTGPDGYIGRVLVDWLAAAAHDVVGLDSRLFVGCTTSASPARSSASAPAGPTPRATASRCT
jgi:hypothetical protein